MGNKMREDLKEVLIYLAIFGGLFYWGAKDYKNLEFSDKEFYEMENFKQEIYQEVRENEESIKKLNFNKNLSNNLSNYIPKIDSIQEIIVKKRNTLEQITEKYSNDDKIRKKCGWRLALVSFSMLLGSGVLIGSGYDSEKNII